MFQANFDNGPHPRAQIGFLAVANADLIERDMFAMRPEGVGLHFTRVPMGTQCTIENLAAIEDDITQSLATLMPARDDVSAISFNCTSASFVIGEERVKDIIRTNRPNSVPTTMISGVIEALKALNVKRVAMGTAYTDDINHLEQTFLEQKGYECVNVEGLSLMTDVEMNRVSLTSLLEFADYIDRPDAEAIFISCGALRSVETIHEAEKRLGKPFICSNQASMWNCLRSVGIKDQLAGFGQLFSEL